MNGPKLVDKASIDAGYSTAVTGETGSGKTTLLKMIAYQMRVSDGTAVVTHDLDSDFHDLFVDMGLDPIRISESDSDAKWNLFRDFGPERIEELAHVLIGDPGPNADQTAIHFNSLATTLLETVLEYLWLEAERHDKQLTNADLKGLAVEMTNEQLADEIEDDFPGQADQIRGDGSGSSIYKSMESEVSSKLVGDFGRKGDFSLTEYLENPDGRVLVVDTSVRGLRMMSSAYSFFLDQAIRLATDNDAVECNFVLDEIDAIDSEISTLPMLASKGRSRNTRVLIGIQTVGQLQRIYGKGSGVLGNCPQEIHMASGDPESNRYARKAVGKRMTTEISHSTSETEHGTTVSSSESRKERNPISEGALNDFATGDAVVINQTRWWMAHVAEFGAVRDRLPCGVDPSYTPDEMMDFLDEHSDDDDGPGGGATSPPSPPSQGGAVQDDEEPETVPEAESHPAESDGWLRRVTGLRSHDTGLTDVGRRLGYGDGDA